MIRKKPLLPHLLPSSPIPSPPPSVKAFREALYDDGKISVNLCKHVQKIDHVRSIENG
jgi:hypothetical protein